MGLTSIPVAASQTLTFSGNAVAAETVVVGGVTYTWRASVGSTANEVLVGADAAASAQNLYDAINATASVSGTKYGSATVKNPLVKATAVTATTVVVKAKTAGTIGNLIASTETMTNGAWGAALLAGGTGSIGNALQQIVSEYQLQADLAQILTDLGADQSAA